MMGAGGGRKDDDAGVADGGEVWYPGDLVDISAFPPCQHLNRTPNRTSLDSVENNACSPTGDGASERYAGLYTATTDECQRIWPGVSDATRLHIAWAVAAHYVPACTPDAARMYCSRHGISRPPQGRRPQDATPLAAAYVECLWLRHLLLQSDISANMRGPVAWYAATQICPVPRQCQLYAHPADDVVLLAKALLSATGTHANAPDPALVLPLVAVRRSGLALFDEAWIARAGRHLDPPGTYVSLQGIPGDSLDDLNALAERMRSQVSRQLEIVGAEDKALAAKKTAKTQARRSRREPDPWRVLREAERRMPIEKRLKLYQLRKRVMFPAPSGGSEG